APEPVPSAKDTKATAKYKARLLSEAWLGDPVATVKVPATTALVAAHGLLYGAGEGVVWAIEVGPGKKRPGIVWQADFEGTAAHLAASPDQLFVSTREGGLTAFGREGWGAREILLETAPMPAGNADEAELARRVLDTTAVRDGYAVLWGAGSDGLVG